MKTQEQKVHKAPFSLIQKIEFPEVFIELYVKNLIVLHYRYGHDVDVALVKKVNDAIKQLVKGESYRVLVKADVGVDFTREGREYSVLEDQTSNKLAWAAVTNSLGHTILVNFFMKLNKPKIPFRMFKTDELALKWLDEFCD